MPDATRRAPRMPAVERRKQIISAAREMILRNGVAAVNMSAIADALGVAKPIIYKHFRNSEDLIVALLDEYADGTVRVVARRISNIESLPEFFSIIIDELFEYIKNYGPIVRNITSGFSASPRIDACVQSMENRSVRVYRYLLIQQGLSEKQASIAAYGLRSMISNTIYEYAAASDADHRATLKAMVIGAVGSLVQDERVKPSLPHDILSDNGNITDS